MGIRQTYKLPDTVTVAGFKDWAMDVGAAMVAMGWQQTNDLNQVNWSTFNPAAPLATGTTFAVEIFKSTDALSSTFPIYVKFYYATRNNASGNNAPMIYAQVGYGTDGFGNMTSYNTGVMGANTGVAGYSGTSAVTTRVEQNYSWYGSGGSFAMALFTHVGNIAFLNACQVFIVERSHDASGNDTDEYVQIVYFATQYTTQGVLFKPQPGGIGQSAGGYGQFYGNQGGFILPDGGAGGYGVAGIQWSPCFPMPGKIGNPMRMLAGFKNADIGDNQIVQCQLYGTTQNYLTYRPSAQPYGVHLGSMLPGGYNQQNNASGNNATIGLRWDYSA